ncbi:MAG: pentapeptide repeat-containing protein [Victivallales bacterium]|nr:pentapeptide repeat-containing protein [Victivallales bacterium]
MKRLTVRIKYCWRNLKKFAVERWGKLPSARLFWLLSWSVVPLILLVGIFLNNGKIFGTGMKDFQNILVLVVGAIPACVLWFYRDRAKQIDQEQTKESLAQTERELRLKEDNDAWDNFCKYQKIVEEENTSDAQKTSAVFALGNYYQRQGTKFPRMIHAFYKHELEKYWNQNPHYHKYLESEKEWRECSDTNLKDELKEKFYTANMDWEQELSEVQLPECIRAIHEVIKDVTLDRNLYNDQSKTFFSRCCGNCLSFNSFNFTRANLSGMNLAETNLRLVDLVRANLKETNLSGAYLGDANLAMARLWDANLNRADLTSANLEGANLRHAYLRGANLGGANLMGTDLNGAIYTKNYHECPDTIWPEGFDPEDPKHGMICLSGNDPL